MSQTSKPNRLQYETSPYLKQHSLNPVDWYPWGDEALNKARKEKKPIFLSIGYSACHWCHVMERESFEDAETAALLNQHFVSIKVDREERPDLDHIYMMAVQALTQHGGWPMTVFLTPELEPFYGGTYFPPDDRMGMPAFKKVILGVANAWTQKKDDVLKSAQQIVQALQEISEPPPPGTLTMDLIQAAVGTYARNFDSNNGGFGTAPKFFHTMDLKVCLRFWKRSGAENALEMLTFTLDQIARGGIYDQLGGGFHRYSTDAQWLAPHFEKMLYDNALLAELYLEAYQVTKKVDYAQVAREVLDYVLREMTSPEGSFYSTQDADSEGVEGKFYVWDAKEIKQLLDAEAAEQFCKVYDVTPSGNWEGHTILRRKWDWERLAKEQKMDRQWLEDTLAPAKRKLLAERNHRPAPFRDEKVIVSWNGLMIQSFAMGYQVLGDDRYLLAAQSAARFLWANMGGASALRHTYKDGHARIPAFLDDYASYAMGLACLFEADFQTDWRDHATKLVEEMIERFWDAPSGTFYFTPKQHEKLIHRPRETHDGATPSASALAVTAVIRWGQILGRPEWMELGEKGLRSAAQQMQKNPSGSGQFLCALDRLYNAPRELVLALGKSEEENESVLQALRSHFHPSACLHPAGPSQPAKDGRATLYVCENFTCSKPLVGSEAILEFLG